MRGTRSLFASRFILFSIENFVSVVSEFMSESVNLYMTSRLAGVMSLGAAVLVLGRYWNWPGSRHKNMPPGEHEPAPSI